MRVNSVAVVVLAMTAVACGGGRAATSAAEPVGGPESAKERNTAARLAGAPLPEAEPEPEAAPGTTVRFDVFIMSKCPFAAKVMEAVLPVAAGLGTRLDLRVDYIGRDADGELTSMHGPDEVAGDTLQLCARATGTRTGWLEFLRCQYAEWRAIPRGWEACADDAGLDVGRLRRCARGEEGRALLRESFARSEARNATGSPTMFVAGEPYKGGRSEEAIGRALCAQLPGEPPAYCGALPVPAEVPVTVISDRRCTSRSCDTARFVSFVRSTFEGARVTELDYSDPEGRRLFEASGERYLPIAVFGPSVESEAAGFDRLRRRMQRLEATEDWVYPLGRDWDPTAEICDDGVDNTGDGKVDCKDPTCEEKKLCRPEKKRALTLFVMSGCPYGQRVEDAMEEVLARFGRDRKKIDFRLEFIGNEEDGELTSMHGRAEVEEDVRQLCAQKRYRKGHKYMDYVWCHNDALAGHAGDDDWTACAKGGIDAEAIRECAEGEEGRRLLSASFALAAELGITGSPTWLLNNRRDMQGRTPAAILREYCAANPGLAECADLPAEEEGAGGGQGEAPALLPAGGCGAGS